MKPLSFTLEQEFWGTHWNPITREYSKDPIVNNKASIVMSTFAWSPMIKRKIAAATVLSAALFLSACGTSEPEVDPLAGLRGDDTNVSVETDNQLDYQEDGEQVKVSVDEEDVLSNEELEALQEESLSETDKDEVVENLSSGEAEVSLRNLGSNFEFGYFGENPSAVTVPSAVEDAFPDDDASLIVSNALEALEWAEANGAAKRPTGERGSLTESLVGYMSGYLTDDGQQKFRDSLNGDTSELIAWSILPTYDDTFSVGGIPYEINPNGIWQNGFGKIKILENMNLANGQPSGGVAVDIPRSVFIPLAESQTEMLAVNYTIRLLMVPGTEQGKPVWNIDDWSVYPSGTELVEGMRPL